MNDKEKGALNVLKALEVVISRSAYTKDSILDLIGMTINDLKDKDNG